MCVCVFMCVQPWHCTSHSHLMIAASHWLPSLLPDQIQLPWTIETSSRLRTPSAPPGYCSLPRGSCWTPNHVEGPQGSQSTPVHTRRHKYKEKTQIQTRIKLKYQEIKHKHIKAEEHTKRSKQI